MPFTSRPDIDTDELKKQAAVQAKAAAGSLKDASSTAATKAVDAAGHAKDWTTPKVEGFIDWLLPRAEHLYRESVKAAAPKVEHAADRVAPAIDTAHDKLVDDLLPRLVVAMNEAAQKAASAADAAADRAAAGAAAVAAAAAAKQEKKHTGAKVFWTLVGLAGAATAYVAWRSSRSTVDPWAEPWEPTDSFGSSDASVSDRTHGARAGLANAAGDAADALGTAAGTAVAKGRDAATKAAETLSVAKDGVSEKVEELGEKVEELGEKAKDAASETARKVTRRAAPKKPDEGTDPVI
jgi:gas vesicle protein